VEITEVEGEYEVWQTQKWNKCEEKKRTNN
jgi:hypothetical protein